MKRLDRLLVSNFIMPFIMAFFIAMFVFIMQFLWKYIDDIVGKGLDLMVILELIFYRSTALIPMSLPVAVLIASVMVMGTMAERFELASIKSAGVSLFRVIRPLFFLTFLIAGGSFLCSNYLIPYSNLKFKSRLYDIRRQKPTLSLAEGAFNNDFGETVIRIGKKDKDNRTLRDISIYDHTEGTGNRTQILADKGEMFNTPDRKYLVMRLFNGEQYQEVKENSKDKKGHHEHIHVRFKEWEKIFDMAEFDLQQTDESLFKSHSSMLTVNQLKLALDSLHTKKKARSDQLAVHTAPYFYHTRMKQMVKNKKRKDSIGLKKPPNLMINPNAKSVDELFKKEQTETLYRSAETLAKNVKNYTRSVKEDMKRVQVAVAEHELEFHRKFSMAMACIIFLFIGAPMGAIVRKGGFGWPLLIAIVFFVSFIMLNIVGEKMAKELVLSPFFGMWMPCLVLFPIGIFLSYMAINDLKSLGFLKDLFYPERLVNLFSKLKR